MGTVRQIILATRKATRWLVSGLLKSGVTPGGGGNAADVGEEAIVKVAQNQGAYVGARKDEKPRHMQEHKYKGFYFIRSVG